MAFRPERLAEGNLCVIWVDDMIDVWTWREAFGLRIETPNLDAMMARAVRFSNAYATVPLCAPCRAEIATGISPFRSGLVDLNRFWRDVMRPEKAWAHDLRRAGWNCEAELRGLPLQRLRVDDPSEPGLVASVYGSALSTVTVFQQRGVPAFGQQRIPDEHRRLGPAGDEPPHEGGRGRVAVDDRDVRALVGQRERRGAADPAARAGDHRNPS